MIRISLGMPTHIIYAHLLRISSVHSYAFDLRTPPMHTSTHNPTPMHKHVRYAHLLRTTHPHKASPMDVVVIVSGDLASGERRVSLGWTVDDLKKKLEVVVGVPPNAQELRFYTADGKLRSGGIDASDTLEKLGVATGWHIRVLDTRPAEERLQLDEQDVEKWEMPQSEYEKRSDSVLAWKRRNRLGRFGDSDSAAPSAISTEPEIVDIPVGVQCRVTLTSGKTANGVTKYVGSISGLPVGAWVACLLDTPDGKNDGTVAGQRLFDAEPNHGIVVRPSAVTIVSADDEEL